MFINKKQLLCSNNFSLEMKKKLTKSCIWRIIGRGIQSITQQVFLTMFNRG